MVSYWANDETNIGVSKDLLMLQVDEMFEIVIPMFIGIAKELSLFSTVNSLSVDLIRYDPVDGSIVVRLSDE